MRGKFGKNPDVRLHTNMGLSVVIEDVTVLDDVADFNDALRAVKEHFEDLKFSRRGSLRIFC